VEVEVERERSVAGEVFFKNGHIALDWRSTASMAGGLDRSAVCGVVVYYFDMVGGFLVFLTDRRNGRWEFYVVNLGCDMRCIVGILLGPAGPET
jgi:hypothetical protein